MPWTSVLILGMLGWTLLTAPPSHAQQRTPREAPTSSRSEAYLARALGLSVEAMRGMISVEMLVTWVVPGAFAPNDKLATWCLRQAGGDEERRLTSFVAQRLFACLDERLPAEVK
jgi:hypothetical protein